MSNHPCSKLHVAKFTFFHAFRNFNNFAIFEIIFSECTPDELYTLLCRFITANHNVSYSSSNSDRIELDLLCHYILQLQSKDFRLEVFGRKEQNILYGYL